MKTKQKTLSKLILAEKNYISWRNYGATKKQREINLKKEMNKNKET